MPRTTAPSEIPLPITYTPTTHRISKAKKGKRVHACEFPGCQKVFTRAEHKRRHELNHNPEALYRCTQAGCKKSFHRPDLLARHMERHDLEAQMDAQARWERQPSTSIDYIPRYTVVPPSPAPYLAMLQPQPIQKTDLAIDSLLWSSMDMPHQNQHSEHAHILPPPRVQESVEEPHHSHHSRFYSSPEACSSPVSDGTTYSVPSGSYSSSISSTSPGLPVDQYPDPIIDSELSSSPAPMHASLEWDAQARTEATAPSMVQMSIPDSLIHPALHYHSQSWPMPQQLNYSENLLPAIQYEQPATDSMSRASSWSL